MARPKSGVSIGGTSDNQGPITAENYVQRAKAFVAARGDAGAGFVIRAIDGEGGEEMTEIPATEPQWIAWLNYLTDLGYFKRIDKRGKPFTSSWMVDSGMATVPCEWPEDFDLAAPMSDRTATLYRPVHSPQHRADMRLRVGSLFQRLSDSLSARQSDGRKITDGREREEVIRQNAERADDLRKEWIANPITLSPAALAKLGVLPKREAAE